MSFAAPLVLLALAGLPALWLLLRLTPPAARRIAFPPLALLAGLGRAEREAARLPWWLLALRLAVAALIVLGLAGPRLGAPPGLPGHGPLLIVIDNSWAAAPDWPARVATARALIAAAAAAHRDVALRPTAPEADASPATTLGPFGADAARAALAALAPMPWPAARTPIDTRGFTTAYVADGLAEGAFAPFLARLAPALIYAGPPAPLLMAPGRGADGALRVRAVNAPGRGVLALDAQGSVLARAVIGADGVAAINLPAAVENRIDRLALEGAAGAGGVLPLGAAARRPIVGLDAGGEEGGGQGADTPFLGALYYLRRALPPGSAVRTAGVRALVKSDAGLIALADVPLDADAIAALSTWMRAGGVLLRFAGPRTAAAPDPLTPAPLLAGDRRLGGALTWTRPLALAPVPPASPLAGIGADGGVSVSRQVLADPTSLDPATVWARLADGTPLILGKRAGKGALIYVLTAANADWSTLPLSGAFPGLLGRAASLVSGGAAPAPAASLPPERVLDGMGAARAPGPAVRPVRAGDIPGLVASPAHPPGVYGGVAIPLAGHVPLARAALPGARGLGTLAAPRDLGGLALAAAALLFAADFLLAVLLRTGMALAAGLALAVLAPSAKAQAPPAALQTRLAYVLTGDAATDRLSADGLGFLAALVSARSAAQIGPPDGVVPGKDDLGFYPLLYWPLRPAAPAPDAAACAALGRFMALGGLLVIDTQGADAGAPGSGAGFAPGAADAYARDTACLRLPPLAPLDAASVITHSFYILDDFPGRFDGAPVLIAAPDARAADGTTPLVVGANDWAGAWARDAGGAAERMPIPGGEAQRVTADHFGINLVIYALTGTYKSDQARLPELLDKLGGDARKGGGAQ